MRLKRLLFKKTWTSIAIAIGIGLIAVGGGSFYFLFVQCPDFSKLTTAVTLPIRNADNTIGKRRVGPKTQNWVSLNDLSPFIPLAVIASEDTAFFQHQGIDFFEIKEAIKKDLKERRFARGASTITQQVIKNIYLSQEKTLSRKIKEALWARKLEQVLSKREILSFYLNMVEWGPGIYGIRDASQHYFNKLPFFLNAKEAAFLAFLLPAPKTYYTYFEHKKLSPFAEKQVERILRVMQKLGFIEPETFNYSISLSLW